MAGKISALYQHDITPCLFSNTLMTTSYMPCPYIDSSIRAGADPGFLKEGGGGSRLGLPAKKGGGPDGGPILGPMLKSLHLGTRGGVLTPPPPGSATAEL